MVILADDAITVLHTDPAACAPEDAEHLVSLLPGDERERAEGMEWPARRMEFVLGRCLARLGFEAFAHGGRHWPIVRSEHGKPAIAAPAGEELSFSIAHTDGAVLCAFIQGSYMGLDVEAVARAKSIECVKERVFSGAELSELESLSGVARNERLLALWTGKEAFTKALGTGLGFDFRQITLGFDGEQPQIAAAKNMTGLDADWHLQFLKLNSDYRVSVAQQFVGASAKPVRFRQVNIEQMKSGLAGKA